jgi:predicted house-cleaning noncanonical NTP pyrophosphatase (MazG superfamily)
VYCSERYALKKRYERTIRKLIEIISQNGYDVILHYGSDKELQIHLTDLRK